MKCICLILAVVALSSAQKAYKGGGAGKHSGQYSGETESYGEAPAPSRKQYNQNQHHHSGAYQHQQQPNQYSGHGASASAVKPNYPQLISDNRQLNQDGTINFNYAADNGLQQGETVDPDGTRRGFYSYIGADGKPLTVKYTAGKNGFIAEGDHLPKQPHAAQAKDEAVVKQSGGGGHDSGAYHGHGGGSSAGNYYGGAPQHYSAAAGPAGPAAHGHGHGHGQAHGHAAGPSPYNHAGSNQYSGAGSNQYSGAGRNHYNPPSPYHDPSAARQAFGGFSGHGAQSHGHGHSHSGQYQSAPQTQYTQSLPSHGHGQGFGGPRPAGSGAMHSAFSPYTPSGPAGPYSGQFDLGNGGHYSINFEPGATQEVNYPAGHGGQARQQQY